MDILIGPVEIIQSVGLSQTFFGIFGKLEVKKNPAYRRHRISRPMRVVAPIFVFPQVSKAGLIAFCSSFFLQKLTAIWRSCPLSSIIGLLLPLARGEAKANTHTHQHCNLETELVRGLVQ